MGANRGVIVQLTAKNKWILVLLGALSGFINGFLGGGGGVLVVSVLLTVLALPQKNAQATALLVILPLTVVSAIVYLLKGVVNWQPTLWATVGVVAGGVVGALLLSRLKIDVIKIIFAVVLILGGIKMLF
jgi:uncharacterized membrane protein YfcA